MPFSFGDCELHPDCFGLRRRGRPVKLEPKVFDVLSHLIEHCDRGMNITSCAICQLFGKHGAMELVP